MIDSLLDKKDFNCCSCLACYNVCPVNAIEVCLSDEGFYAPKVNKEKCINCGKCLCAVRSVARISAGKTRASPCVICPSGAERPARADDAGTGDASPGRETGEGRTVARSRGRDDLAYRQTKRDSARAHSADGNGEDASEREAEHARR